MGISADILAEVKAIMEQVEANGKELTYIRGVVDRFLGRPTDDPRERPPFKPTPPPIPVPPPVETDDPCAKYAPDGEMPNAILYSYCKQANPNPAPAAPPVPGSGPRRNQWSIRWDEQGRHFLNEVRKGPHQMIVEAHPGKSYRLGWVHTTRPSSGGTVKATAYNKSLKLAENTGNSSFGYIDVHHETEGNHRIVLETDFDGELNFQLNELRPR